MNKYFREPISGFTHLAGAFLSFAALLAMVIKTTLLNPAPKPITAVIIFGISLILLYSASATYHLVVADNKIVKMFRKIDHAMIFILIAGSYAPYCLIALSGITGYSLFTIIAILGICGALFKILWFKCPRWVSTILYVGMGWLALFIIIPLYQAISLNGISLLIGGGLLYTIGAVIYQVKPSKLKLKNFKHHDIFHIFVMLGSLAHFFSVYFYVI
jgi:hemolysin III